MKNYSLLLFLAFNLSIFAQDKNSKSVLVEGKKMSYKTFNLENRKDGEPILVFEAGLGGGTFDPILPHLPNTISGIEYERNGLGQSEADPKISTDSQVVERLHSMLQLLNIKPPYLLVGHSIGGPYIRLFAAKYPDEVSGLVFSDPTDFMLTKKENEEAKIKSGSQTGYQEISNIIIKTLSQNKNVSQGTRDDAARALRSHSKGYFNEYTNLPALNKKIATTVIISYNKHIETPDEEMNKNLNLGINFKAWWKEYDNLRVQHFSDLIKDNDNSMIILLPKYSHGIHYQNPKLVANFIIENYNRFNK
ncbi:alpha/beta hydrolase [Epilithonimonas xixisoli]|uniref:Pimeloyl-ACP methyl ester carboxylesterase n=1 Tax=Epilithonimonas xixisoli TaxID=1476462 RepID=A0A4R8IAK0_9FLAO|nr:alpha/beta hydrolase [Epilithonimonas xixisoli]TDX87148.1 pimeloyl-ACP methyl ester carboxylesterase [Epilithonimonas xixisoli]